MSSQLVPEYLTRDQAGEVCNVSGDYIARQINAGRLRAKRTGADSDGNGTGKYLISREALREWFEGLPNA